MRAQAYSVYHIVVLLLYRPLQPFITSVPPHQEEIYPATITKFHANRVSCADRLEPRSEEKHRDMGAAVVATILGTVLSFSLQVAKDEIIRKINDTKVTTCFESLLEDMNNLSGQCGDYHMDYKDRSEEWREKVTNLKKLAYKIED